MKTNLQQQCVCPGRVAGNSRTSRKYQLSYWSVIGAVALALVPGAAAQVESTNKVTKLEGVTVVGRAEDLVGVADSATQGTVGQAELARRPLLRPGEVLETVPGVIITQHAGGGKANQYFLRGFNLDHGTDFATTVDGVPINLGTHAHGQGYTDINWVIPELLRGVSYRKGPYYAEAGDFGTVGTADLSYLDQIGYDLLKVEGGMNNYGRLLWASSPKLKEGNLIYALEGLHDDGAWEEPADYWRGNGMIKYSRGDESLGWSVSGLGYYGDWTSTDQIPKRAINGRNSVPGGFNLDRFGTLDPDSGGSSWRGSLSGEWHRRDDRGVSSAMVYGYHYGLDLYSNFTGALNQTDGDEIFQRDRRFVTGTRLSHTWLNEWDKRSVETKLGLDVRADIVSAGLFTSENREVLTTTRDDHATTVGVSPYLENKLQWTDWFRTVAGVRGDIYSFDVDNEAGGASRSTTDAIASPKLNLIFGPWADTEFYLSGGLGFHTADARGTATATDRADVFTQQQGAEFGIRTRAVKGLQSTLSFWVLDSDDETVFVGDAGTTEPSGRKGRRYGVEFANFYDITPWLALDADVSLSRARFRDHDPAGDHIPDAVESVVAVGLSVHDLGGFFGSVRLRYFGARALIEDDSVRSGSSTIVNLQVGYQINKTWSATVDVLNLFDARVNDQEYYYSSRLPGEPAGPEADGGYLDRHVHPAEPLTLRVGLTAKF